MDPDGVKDGGGEPVALEDDPEPEVTRRVALDEQLAVAVERGAGVGRLHRACLGVVGVPQLVAQVGELAAGPGGRPGVGQYPDPGPRRQLPEAELDPVPLAVLDAAVERVADPAAGREVGRRGWRVALPDPGGPAFAVYQQPARARREPGSARRHVQAAQVVHADGRRVEPVPDIVAVRDLPEAGALAVVDVELAGRQVEQVEAAVPVDRQPRPDAGRTRAGYHEPRPFRPPGVRVHPSVPLVEHVADVPVRGDVDRPPRPGGRRAGLGTGVASAPPYVPQGKAVEREHQDPCVTGVGDVKILAGDREPAWPPQSPGIGSPAANAGQRHKCRAERVKPADPGAAEHVDVAVPVGRHAGRQREPAEAAAGRAEGPLPG